MNTNKCIRSSPYIHLQRQKCIDTYMHREASFALLHTLPHRFLYTRWPHTPPGTETHANKTGPPGFFHTHTHKQNTHRHTQIYTHFREDIFLALVLTTYACKLDFQNVLILCWHLLRQNRGRQTQSFGWADASLVQCNVRNCWCRINAHFYEFILCHRVEKNLGVNIHHMA